MVQQILDELTSRISTLLQMFSRNEQSQAREYDTSALPGGKKPAGPFLSTLVSWRDLISIQLPEKGALDTYLKQFFDSVDWFMMVM